MSKSEQRDERDPLRRTMQEIKEFASLSKGENYCCVQDLACVQTSLSLRKNRERRSLSLIRR